MGIVAYFNQRAHDISLELMDKPISAMLPLPEFRESKGLESLNDAVRNSKTSTIPYRLHYTVKNSHGTNLFLQVSFTRVWVRHNAQHVHHVLILINDLTEQRIFEQKLSSQSAYITGLIRNANAVIFSVDTRGYVTEWNHHAVKVTGFNNNEIYARKMTEMLKEGHVKSIFEGYLQHILELFPLGNLELPIVSKNGKAITLLLSGSAQLSTDGVAVGVTFVGQDITELSEYRKSLESMVEERTHELQRALTQEQEAVELKSKFVAIASHEFRIPLSSIRAASKSLREMNGKQHGQSHHDKLDCIERHVNHMASLLDDVLTYGKANQPRLRMMKSTVNLRNLLHEVVEDVGQSNGRTHEFVTDILQIPETLFTDGKMLRGILVNLLTNATKFSPGKEKVTLSANHENNMLVISVTDEGVGIPDDERDHIFEPFSRGRNAEAIDGTGLGLSIVKKTVETLLGTINVRSEPGKGSTFIVRIPTT